MIKPLLSGEKEALHFQTLHRHKDGHDIPVEIFLQLVREIEGTSRFIAVVHDVSKHKEVEKVLIEAKEAADSANRAKSAFLAAMSHELRTPMNGVVGMVDLLRETDLNQDQRKMVGTARDSALGLLRILDDILDFSKIEAGKLVIEQIPLSLDGVMESVARTLSTNAIQKQIQFEIFIAPSLPNRLQGDPVRLRQILYNLGGNAIKFTENREGKPGKVMIRIERAGYETAGQALIRFRVIDNGIGTQLTRLFLHPLNGLLPGLG